MLRWTSVVGRKIRARHIDLGLAITDTLAGLTLLLSPGCETAPGTASFPAERRTSSRLRFQKCCGQRPHIDRIVIVQIGKERHTPSSRVIPRFPQKQLREAQLSIQARAVKVIARQGSLPDPGAILPAIARGPEKEIGANATPSTLIQQVNELEVASDQDP